MNVLIWYVRAKFVKFNETYCSWIIFYIDAYLLSKIVGVSHLCAHGPRTNARVLRLLVWSKRGNTDLGYADIDLTATRNVWRKCPASFD